MRICLVICMMAMMVSTARAQVRENDDEKKGLRKSDSSQQTQKQVDKTDKEERPSRFTKIYHLSHAKASNVAESLRTFSPEGSFGVDARLNAILVSSTQEGLVKIGELIKMLDGSVEEEATEIVVSQLKAVEPIARKFAEISDVKIEIDDDTGVMMVKGAKDEVKRVLEVIERIRETTEAIQAKAQSYAIRVLWLSNDPDEDRINPIKTDAGIDKAIQKLSGLGFPNMKVKMQSLGRCDLIHGGAKCSLTGSSVLENTLRSLSLQANVRRGNGETFTGTITIDASVSDVRAKGSAGSKNQMEVAVQLQPQKYYILSASPIGDFQSAFVIQLIEDL